MKKKNIYFWLIVISLSYAGFTFLSSLKEARDKREREGYFIPEKTGDYKFLFTKTKSDSIEPDFVYVSNVSYPISTFDYTNQDDSYKIIIYKFLTKKNQNPLKEVGVNSENTSINGKVYNGIKLNPHIDADVRFESKLHYLDNIAMSINGNSIKNSIKTDSLLGYDFKMINAGIIFNKDSDPNICLMNDYFFNKVSTQILFYKQNNFLYLLILASSNSKDITNPNLLLSLIKK